jgi:aerobic-type carbon monoxide dehydrogenase small subunit (CoxS/CutS family)
MLAGLRPSDPGGKNMNDERDGAPLPEPSRRLFLKSLGVAGAAGSALLGTTPDVSEGAAAEKAPPGSLDITLKVNDKLRKVQVEPRTTLLDALRIRLEPNLTGAKLVCGEGTCGACTVLLDGKTAYACLVLAVDAVGRSITTIEGLGTPEAMSPLQSAFVEKDALMCGFCTPGFVTSLTALLRKNPNPNETEVREACHGNFCRCGTYPRIFEAALSAAKTSTAKKA